MAGRMTEPCWRPFKVYRGAGLEDEAPKPQSFFFYDQRGSHDAVFRCNTVEDLRQLAASAPSRNLSKDLWVAVQCAEKVLRGNTTDELLRLFSEWLKTEYGNATK
jgi:hypothetical protein